MTTDPGVFAPREIVPPPPELAALQERLGRAIDYVDDLGKAHADTIRAKAVAEKRAKEWADIAYEMWALLANSQHDGQGAPDAGARWQVQKGKLRTRLFAMLDGEDLKETL